MIDESGLEICDGSQDGRESTGCRFVSGLESFV